MNFSPVRLYQWGAIAFVLVLGAGLYWKNQGKNDVDAGVTINAPQEDHIATTVRGYWKMDEGTGTSTTADSSGNANTLTMTNADAEDWQTGNIGPFALDFNGTDEYLTVTDPASGVLDFVAGTSFTLTGWFNRDTFDNDHTIIAKKTIQDTNTADGYIVWVDGTDDLLHFRADENGSADAYSITSTSAFTSAGWNHFAISWNDSVTTNNPVNVYINGALNGDADQGSGTFANVGTLGNTEAFRIGAESGTADNFFDGKLDDVRVYGFPLSADEVSKLYQTTAPMQVQLDSGLVGYWTFNGPDIKGSTVIDRSGKGNDGTITGAVPAKGKLGQGMRFDGSITSYVDIGDVLDLGDTDDVSISLWFKTQDTSGSTYSEEYLVAKKSLYTASSAGYSLTLFKNGAGGSERIEFFVSDGLNDFYIASKHQDQMFLGWHHCVVTFDQDDSSNSNIYINATDAVDWKTGIIANVGDTQNALPLRFGQSSTGNGWFSGALDDIHIYRRALSATEVMNLYNLGR